MDQLERLLKMAEDELAEYSTKARKIEKLRRKIGLSVPIAEQRRIKEALLEEVQPKGLRKLVAEQRQAVALPFWGIAGLGILDGISLEQPLGWLAAIVGVTIAIALQKWGWELQAKWLLFQTLEEIEAATAPAGSSSQS